MNIEIFQKNFQMRDIDIKPYIIMVSIFITILLTIVLINNKLEDYFICDSKVIDNNLLITVNNKDLEKVMNNKKLKIERNIFTYKVKEIKEVTYAESYYYNLLLELNKIPKDLFVDNNIINIKIIVNKMTIFDYLIKTLKGE